MTSSTPLSEQSVEAASDADSLRHAADRQQRSRDVRLGARAAVVADAESLVVAAEEHFHADGVSGEADRMNLLRANRRAAAGSSADGVRDWDGGLGGLPALRELPRQLASSAARRIGLGVVR